MTFNADRGPGPVAHQSPSCTSGVSPVCSMTNGWHVESGGGGAILQWSGFAESHRASRASACAPAETHGRYCGWRCLLYRSARRASTGKAVADYGDARRAAIQPRCDQHVALSEPAILNGIIRRRKPALPAVADDCPDTAASRDQIPHCRITRRYSMASIFFLPAAQHKRHHADWRVISRASMARAFHRHAAIASCPAKYLSPDQGNWWPQRRKVSIGN